MTVTEPTYFLLYVSDVASSAKFYERLLDRQPVEASPNFAMFILATGVKLGLWSSNDVEPVPTHSGSGGELGFLKESRTAVDDECQNWKRFGIPILQEPVQMGFGYTFLGADPDGHRLRVFAPGE